MVYRYLPLSDKQVFSTRPVCARWYIWLLHMGSKSTCASDFILVAVFGAHPLVL